MTIAQRLAVVAALTCTLAGCADMIDADQPRPCRPAIPALNLSASDIEILRPTPLATRDGVRVEYRARTAAGSASDRFLECRFAAGAIPSERTVIVEANTESGPLSD